MQRSREQGDSLFTRAMSPAHGIRTIYYAVLAVFVLLMSTSWLGPAAAQSGKVRTTGSTQPNGGGGSMPAGVDDIDTCSCPNLGSPTGSGFTSTIDVVMTVNVVFRGNPEVFDPDCPVSRTDVNCDGVTNVADLILIELVGFGGSSPDIYCDPCDPEGSGPPCTPDTTSPGNSVVVESRSVTPGETGVEIGVYLDNAVDLIAVTLPLEIREVTPGAFPAANFSFVVQGRLAASGVTDVAAIGYASDPALINDCSGPISHTWNEYGDDTTGFYTSPDAIFWSGHQLFTNCLAAGSDGAPGSGTPSLLMTFDVSSVTGTFEIDTACFAPGNHLLFMECGTQECLLPAFTKGVITIGDACELCNRTSTDRYLLACPRGDIFFNVRLACPNGDPLVGYSDVWLDFSSCSPSEFFPVPDLYPEWPIVRAAEPSDSSGLIRFAIAAGGSCVGCVATVHTACGFSKVVPVRSTDVNGDSCVTPADYDDALGICRDLNADGIVNDLDLTRHVDHCCDHCFPDGPCAYLAQEITLEPGDNLEAGDTVTVDWRLDNHHEGGVCHADSVVLFQSKQSPTPTWEWIGSVVLDTLLLPGDLLTASIVDHAMPLYGNLCLMARLYNDCCGSVEEVTCRSFSRQCPPASTCFIFYTSQLENADGPIDTTRSDPGLLAQGWTWEVKDTTIDLDSTGPIPPEDLTMTRICTSEFTPVGSRFTLAFTYEVGGNPAPPIAYTVIQDYFEGDLSGGPNNTPNCVVDVLDIVFLVNYVFRSGIPPIPPENADINCDGLDNVIDVVWLIDFAFRGRRQLPDCDGGPER